MKYHLFLSKKAIKQIKHACDWYKEQQLGLDILFLTELDKNILYVEKNPLKSQVRYKEVRIRFLKKFDFGIHYILEEKNIFVLAVFHTSQSDKKWR